MTLDMTTMTIMRKLPREVDPVVYHMMTEDPGEVAYNSIGGLSEQIRELREVRGRKATFNLTQQRSPSHGLVYDTMGPTPLSIALSGVQVSSMPSFSHN